MTAKEYLRQIKDINELIDAKLMEIYKLRTLASSISVSTKEDCIQTSGSKDRMGDTVAKIVDLERRVDSEIDRLVNKRDEITSKIDKMGDSTEKTVLYLRYVSMLKWDSIADQIAYTPRHVQRVHGDALNVFRTIYGDKF